MVFILEFLGTVAFAISGASTGVQKKMDIFGVSMLAMTTAVGGGILRDIILNVTPPAAFRNPVFTLTSIATGIIVFYIVRQHYNFYQRPWGEILLRTLDAVCPSALQLLPEALGRNPAADFGCSRPGLVHSNRSPGCFRPCFRGQRLSCRFRWRNHRCRRRYSPRYSCREHTVRAGKAFLCLRFFDRCSNLRSSMALCRICSVYAGWCDHHRCAEEHGSTLSLESSQNRLIMLMWKG